MFQKPLKADGYENVIVSETDDFKTKKVGSLLKEAELGFICSALSRFKLK